MIPESSQKRRDLWLPCVVGAVGVLLATAGWWALVMERREGLLEATRTTASSTTRAVELQLERQLEILAGLGHLWRDFGLRPLPEWTAHVDHRLGWVAGLAEVAWVDLTDPQNRVATGRSGGGPSPLDLDAIRRDFGQPRLEGPFRDASGDHAYRLLLPVETVDHDAGVLVGRFAVGPFLDDVLRARAAGYAITVYWHGEPIFRRGQPSTDRWQGWWSVEQEIELPLGGRWRIVHQPTPELAAARLTPVPHYLLLVGLVLALVIALVAHQLRVIVRQSRFLALTNQALEERGAELESKVAERTEALQEAVEELEAFNYSVSHDLRSPLGAILNFTAILEEDYRDRPLDAEGLGLLSRIRRSGERATVLLQDLLQLSRAGRAALDRERIDMTSLARECFAQARAAEGDPEVEFRLDPLPDALGDRTLLGDVLINLFSNALKYSRGREKRRIVVTGEFTPHECIYEVADNGAGFDMRFADKLFGLFERLHADEDIEGTGIGLAMVARIVKRHGGRVWAEGRPGEGASFGFAIPTGDGS